ncbi:dTMP kinase [Patescibacteria group bacterium]
MYIVFEGVVGTGKSTQIKKLHKYLQEKYPEKEVVLTREPGGTEVSETIRNVVQGKAFDEEMEPVCEAYLYASSRAQSLRTVVKPVLDKGGVVVSDRSVFSSLSNQAYGRELGFDKVYSINKEAVGEFWPDIVIYLSLPIDVGLGRVFDEGGDKFEKLGTDFYKKVEKGYKAMSQKSEFKDKWVSVDASGSEEEVFEKMIKALEPLL